MSPVEDHGELRRSSRSNLGKAPVRYDELSYYHIAESMQVDEMHSLLMQQLHHCRN